MIDNGVSDEADSLQGGLEGRLRSLEGRPHETLKRATL
jgi:hypothetical protein